MLGSIVAFALGLNLPRAVLLSSIALAGHSSYLLLREKTSDKKFSLLKAVRASLQRSRLGAKGNQPLLVLILLLTFGYLVALSNLINDQNNAASIIEYLVLFPICMSLAAGRLNNTTPRELTRLAISYSTGSLIYVLACLIYTRSQEASNLFYLFYRQSHNELLAPWGHFNNVVNLRTIEQSLLFPISLFPISVVALTRSKGTGTGTGTGWLFAFLTGTLALFLSRTFNSQFPLLTLSLSSGFVLALPITYSKANIQHFLRNHKKPITISAATLVAAIAGSYLTIEGCIIIDERLSRAAAAIHHLHLLPKEAAGLSFSYKESCANKTVTFASTAGDSLHNIFLDYSVQAGLIAGASLFVCTVLLTRRVFSKYFELLRNRSHGNNEVALGMAAAVSVIGTSWALWLFQPVSSSNFSMFICSLYFLSLCSGAVVDHPGEDTRSRLTN